MPNFEHRGDQTKNEQPKVAVATDTISRNEQRYIKGESVGDLPFTTAIKVLRVKGEEVLVEDITGQFWVPLSKLEIKE